VKSDRVIWKYPLQIVDRQIVEMPHAHRFLGVQSQNGVPTLWAQVNPLSPTVKLKIACIGTGNPTDVSLLEEHLGTVFIGDFVWHFFLIGSGL
jgi:hypothetical protein